MEPINAKHQDMIYTVKQDHLMLLVRYNYLLLHVHWKNGSKIYMSYIANVLIKSAWLLGTLCMYLGFFLKLPIS